jgi:hypothetical protein
MSLAVSGLEIAKRAGSFLSPRVNALDNCFGRGSFVGTI